MAGRGYNSDFLDKLREKNDLKDVVANYVPVIRRGRGFWACCPFHHEKTPSFSIHADNFYHCFGCGESGDVITFVMKIESLDFQDAVKFLAKRCGEELPEFKGERQVAELKRKKERFIEMLDVAKKYYQSQLYQPEGRLAVEYIKKRGLTKTDVDNFEIGYSSDWMGLITHLRKAGYKDSELNEVGILVQKDGKEYDFFAKRLMFPLCNKFGDCIGFSGRDIEGKSPAKYKNSSQSIVFDKSTVIYGLHLVKKLRTQKNLPFLIICEGQMDVIAMHSAGFTNSVACLGTAFTDYHAKELARVSDKLYLCFDGDEAGQHAAMRAIPILQTQPVEIKVINLTGGKDPDEIIKANGVEYMQHLVDNAVDCIEFQIRYYAKECNMNSSTDKVKFLSKVHNLLMQFKLNSQKELYLPLISKLTGTTIESLKKDMFSSFKEEKISTQSNLEKLSTNTYTEDALLKAQKFILAGLINNIDYVEVPQGFNMLLKNPSYKRIYDYIMKERSLGKEVKITNIFDKFNGEQDQAINELLNLNFYSFEQTGPAYFKACLKKIELAALLLEQDKLKKAVTEQKDIEIKKHLLIEYNELAKKISALKKNEN